MGHRVGIVFHWQESDVRKSLDHSDVLVVVTIRYLVFSMLEVWWSLLAKVSKPWPFGRNAHRTAVALV